MKKFLSFSLCLILILSLSIGGVFIVNNFASEPAKRTYSQTNNITSQVNQNMSVNDIADLYLNSCVSVYVQTGENGYSLGSGVCVASCGYQTSSGYVASQGAYFVTNYHVISRMVERDYQNLTSHVYVILDKEELSSAHECSIVWHDKDVDMALLYCDQDLMQNNENFGWVSIKDRFISQENSKISFDEIFTIGSPLNLEYQNTFSKGYISNQTLKNSFTTTRLYVYGSDNNYKFTSNEEDLPPRQTLGYYDVLNNAYSDLIMMNLDITNGNSGGGVFDKNGFVIGLSTLGIDNELANTSALNFAVPIYPLTLVLDNVVEFNEGNLQENNVIQIKDLGIFGVDKNEVEFMKGLGTISETKSESYYLDENFIYPLYYPSVFEFEQNGYVILKTSDKSGNIESGFVVTSVKKGEDETPIYDRNDLIYFLYSCRRGEEIGLNGYYLGEKIQEICYLIEL